MNNTVYLDSSVSDDVRRQQLYEGQLFVYSARPSSVALCEFARGLIEEAFKGMDPRTAQDKMTVEEYAAILGQLKPNFIHHPNSKELLRRLLDEMGCDREKTYLTCLGCVARQAETISRLGSPTHGIHTGIRGIRLRIARSIGGSQSMESHRIMPWHSIQNTGTDLFGMIPLNITMRSGTKTSGSMQPNIPRKIHGLCLGPRNRWSLILRFVSSARRVALYFFPERRCIPASRIPRVSLGLVLIFERYILMTLWVFEERRMWIPNVPARR
jgi:hypothetical protein